MVSIKEISYHSANDRKSISLNILCGPLQKVVQKFQYNCVDFKLSEITEIYQVLGFLALKAKTRDKHEST